MRPSTDNRQGRHAAYLTAKPKASQIIGKPCVACSGPEPSAPAALCRRCGACSIYVRLSSIKEEEGVPPAEEMIKQLVQGQEAVTRTARSIFPLLDKVSDEPTADLLTQRMQVHEKTAWMLRSLLEGQ